MKRKSLFQSLIYGNKAIVICVSFTLATMIDLLICTMQGILEISYWHLGNRFLMCVLIVLSFYLFKLFDRLPLYAMLLIHFVIGILIMLGNVWVTSLYLEVHPNAYRDAVKTVLIIYPVIIVGCIAIDAVRTAKANRILKKRQNEKVNMK